MASSSSSSSSSSMPGCEYDVFLSFHGEDTRRTFVSCLYMFLTQRGYRTFKDDKELERGKFISPELKKNINESRIAVIVFSKNYASSSWCLDELVEILECRRTKGQIILPLFYDVEPTEVRKQTGNFGEAFTRFEGIRTANEVKRWRAALEKAADISGLVLEHAANGEWGAFMEQIVQHISRNLRQRSLKVADHEVGIDSRANKLITLLNDTSKDKLFIGICGTGGIGKTTVAKAVFNKICNEFESSCFLNNVREELTKHGLDKLQERLLSETLMDNDIRISNIDVGIKVIEERLRKKKILIILDDVDNEDQLLNLVGIGHNWFGLGSRIIITTRNERLLRKYGVKICKAKLLDYFEALELFSWHAFEQNSPETEFLQHSNSVIKYAQGLPLALQVLGSLLRERNMQYWVNQLDELKRNPPDKIQDVLKISYDNLNEYQKAIFLDIACFFKGSDKNSPIEFFESCEFQPVIGIEVLIERSLITISIDNKFSMHDLIQEMGREIVRQESKDPAKRSRLWSYEDICKVFNGDTVPENIEGIMLIEVGEEGFSVNPDVLLMMKKLRILIISTDVKLLKCLEFLPNQLRCFQWNGYHGECLPPLPKGLVRLELSRSYINRIPLDKNIHRNLKVIDFSFCKNLVETLNFYELPCLEELNLIYCRSVVVVEFHGMMKNLKFINLHGCQNLKKVSDLSQLPCMEKFCLQDCRSLIGVYPPFDINKRLVELDFYFCKNMKSLPTGINLKFLRRLYLGSCIKLEKFSEINGDMECLKELDLSDTAVKELPPSFMHLKGLESLCLRRCKMFESLPNNIGEMKSLKLLDLRETAMKDLPSSVEHLKGLVKLDLENCKMLESLPNNIGEMMGLKALNLSGTAIKDLPSSVEHLKGLEELYLGDCKMLESLPSNIGEMKSLKILILGGTAIKDLPPSVVHLKGLKNLFLDNCKMLESLPSNIFGEMKRLGYLYLQGSAIKYLPLSVEHLKRLLKLSLANCKMLESLPSNICEMEGLVNLELARSGIKELPSFFAQLTNLQALDCDGCNLNEESICNLPHSLATLNLSRNSFASLPASFTQLTHLSDLRLDGCLSLKTLESLPSNILNISAQGCVSLERYSLPTSDQHNSLLREQNLTQVWTFTESYKLVENHGSNKPNIYSKSQLQDIVESCILLPGSEIPSWFTHISESREDPLRLSMDPNSCCDLKGITVCSVIRIDHDHQDWIYFSLYISGHDVATFRLNNCVKSSSDHIMLFHTTNLKKWYQWLSCNSDARYIEASISINNSESDHNIPPLKVKKWGIHLEMNPPARTQVYREQLLASNKLLTYKRKRKITPKDC